MLTLRLAVLVAAVLTLGACASLSGGGTNGEHYQHVCQTGGRGCG